MPPSNKTWPAQLCETWVDILAAESFAKDLYEISLIVQFLNCAEFFVFVTLVSKSSVQGQVICHSLDICLKPVLFKDKLNLGYQTVSLPKKGLLMKMGPN